MSELRICIDARLVSGEAGGVEQVIIGLASALSKLSDGQERYFFLTYGGSDDWLYPYIKSPCHILSGPPALVGRTKGWLTKTIPWLPDVYDQLRCLYRPPTVHLEESDGTIERARIDVMHFALQSGFLTRVPSIYEPYDLQHVHFPQFFRNSSRVRREERYRAFCAQAQVVVAMSAWTRTDLIRQYGLPPDKVAVVPGAPVLTAYATPGTDDLRSVAHRFNLPPAFVFYPAGSWPHKNHMGLLQALAILREQHNLRVPLVCSGIQNAFFREIKRKVRKLKLQNEVQFLGYVSPLEIACLYRLSRCVVFPSLFEGFGMPVVEAQLAGVPVACSAVTCLPELVGDAAVIFDPQKPQEIAVATLRMWREESLRRALVESGRANVARFSWERTARIFRAHYRRLANRRLAAEDRDLLEVSPTIQIPERATAAPSQSRETLIISQDPGDGCIAPGVYNA